jgi:uncharacterized protein with PIN domain
MSNYPNGCPGPQSFTSTVYCASDTCNHVWEAEFITDLGMTDFVNPEDSDCPECGTEGE